LADTAQEPYSRIKKELVKEVKALRPGDQVSYSLSHGIAAGGPGKLQPESWHCGWGTR